MFFNGRFAINTSIIQTWPFSKSAMKTLMVLVRQNSQIFWTIVYCIAVNMMNMHSFRGIHHYTMFVRPPIWHANFYLHVIKPGSNFMKAFRSNWQCYFCPTLFQLLPFNGKHLGVKCFARALFTSFRVIISLAIRTFPAQNCSVAKFARFWN